MNPNYSNSGAINPGNSQNEANPRTMRNFNTFPMSYDHYLTARFGDVTPFYVFESEPKDKVPFSSFHELRTYTLSSVMMSKIRMMKDYFSVPYKAILPNTWDLIYTNPTQGDDVPDDAICVVKDINAQLNRFSKLTDNANFGQYLNQAFRKYFLLEAFYSDGGLLSLLGCKLNKYFRYGSEYSNFDLFSNQVLSHFRVYIKEALTANGTFALFNSDQTQYIQIYSGDNVDIRRVIEWMRMNPDFDFTYTNTYVSETFAENLKQEFSFIYIMSLSTNDVPVNFSRLIAYQLSYFHFMTNDKVDFIYSADLYRQMMYSLLVNARGLNWVNLFFDYNGSKIQYDAFSGKLLKLAFDICLEDINKGENFGFVYLMELLSFRKSLKYGDYFTGSRPSPLAVGDVNAPVTGDGVSAIDITKNIMMQRFLNAVNKTGRKMSDYLKSIRGANTMPLLTDPKFLARDTVTIGSQEIENTAENQGNIVSLMRSEQSKYAFEVDVEDPCIILGVCSFDVVRLYSQTIDRQFFIKDRFDMFNPYMQNIGDQEIFAAEKKQGGLYPFSYTLRHMEFKQRYSIASAGFVRNLPSWAFIADNKGGDDEQYDNLSPEFIRSHNVELDRFYVSLTGLTLCDYFHFIFHFVNQSSPNRNMEYSPTIL